jgi:PEP-CTERM motif
MKTRCASLTLLCLALAAVPAFAASSQFYDNGPINGTTDAWTINFGYVVSNTFFTSNYNVVTNIQFGVWEFPGDSMSSIDWSITDGENSPCPSELCLGNGTVAGKNLTDNFISTNQYGYNIDSVNALIPGLQVPEGVQLWLNLANAAVPSGDPVYWDENSGKGCGGPMCPSSASESSVGTIPSEAFTLYGTPSGGTTPEPSSIMLFGSGILGLAGLLRRKLL